MRRLMSNLFSAPAAAAAILALSPATACQARNDAMPTMDPRPVRAAAIGLWEIRLVSPPGPGSCRLALREDALADGYAVVLSTCDLKAAGRAHHWRTSQAGLSLVDAAGATLIVFTPETEDGWTGVGADGREYRMTRAAMF